MINKTTEGRNIPRIQAEITSHLAMIDECRRQIAEANDVETLFSLYSFIYDRLETLRSLTPYWPEEYASLSLIENYISDEKEKNINDFIERSFSPNTNFFYSFEPWKQYLTYSNAALLEELFRKSRIYAPECKNMIVKIRSFAATQRDIANLIDAGIDRYAFCCLLDIHTCPVCGNLDGKDFAVSEAVPGVNLPPMHDGCRCFIGPYQPKEEMTGNRTAQSSDGGWLFVPETMTYQEWYAKYVKGHESQLIEADNFQRNRYSYTANMPRVKKVIEQNPGILQKNLPEHLDGIPKHVILGNLKNLVEEGTVIKKRAGNSFALYLSE